MQAAPLHDHALLSDCHGAALVTRDATIDWLCLPRFDSGSLFGALLDCERGGALTVRGAGGEELGAEDACYLEDAMAHQATLTTPGGRIRVVDSLGSPGAERRRLIRVVEGVDGTSELCLRISPRFDYGEVRPWLRGHADHLVTAIGGNDGLAIYSDATLHRDGDHDLVVRAAVGPRERLRLVLSYAPPHELADGGAERLDPEAADALLEEAVAWWRERAPAHEGATADPRVRRSALVLRGLVYEPTGAIVAAPTTSLPETPDGERTWDYRYSWVRDATFTSRAISDVGWEELARRSAAFVARSAAGHAEDLQVLYGVGGERRLPELELDLAGYRGAQPVRVGNAAEGQVQRDVLGEILEQVWRQHERGDDPDEDEWRFIVSLVEHAARRWREPDRGFWEWRGEPRRFVHSAAACHGALDCGLRLAEARGQEAPEEWREARDAIVAELDAKAYDEERGTFVQAIGERDLDATALLLPHTGYVAWDDPRMISTADVIRRELDHDGLIARYDADDGLPGSEGCFLACTFWLAELLARQGRTDDATEVYERACATASPLGLFAEEHDPGRGLPLGNYPQGLTHLSHICAAMALDVGTA